MNQLSTAAPESVDLKTQPMAPGVQPSPLQNDNPPMRLDILRSVLHHKRLAVLAFVLALAIGVPFAGIKGKPKYMATAVIFVSPRFVANLEDGKEFDLQSNTQYREYVQQNVRTINRYDIMQDALDRLGPRRDFWIKGQETPSHAIERLQTALQIEPIADTYQIAVSLTGESPRGLAELVNAVVDAFLGKIKSEDFYEADGRIRDLRVERAKLANQIAAVQQRRAELAQTLGVSTFSEGFPNPYDQLLVDAKSTLADARHQRIQAQAQVNALSSPFDSKGTPTLEAYAADLANKDSGLSSLDANLNARRSLLLTSISGLSPEHPGRKAAEKELKELEDARNRVFQERQKFYANTMLQQRQADFVKASTIERNLTQELDRQAAQASTFSRGYQEAMSLGLDMERSRKRLDSVDDRINFLSLESRAPGFARLFSAARPPEHAIKGGRMRLALAACFAAFLFAVFVPVAVDYLDPRIHWPGDLQRVLGFRGAGWIPEKTKDGQDFQREQLIRIASRLIQDHETNKSQIFAFTAVKSRNGTTTIVNEVARALTRLGVSTLAVEANAYRADPVYRNPNSRGLTVILRGQSDLTSEVVPADDELPDHLPVGDIANFESLPDLRNLIQVLRDATKVYSMILVDLPPILASVDAELIARSVDATILVVEAERVTKTELRRAARLLERLRPAAVTAILNRVTLEAAAGFGKEMRDEFYSGVAKPPSYWLSPWLWR